MEKVRRLVCALVILGGIATLAATTAAAQCHDDQWERASIYFTPTMGKAGYHMSSVLQCSSPNSCDIQQADGWVRSGPLPPGLELYSEPVRIDGVPKEPGDWDFTVEVKGPGECDVSVHMHISGDAVQSLP